MNRRLFVSAVGDANDPLTWSGIPYHLTRVGREARFVDEGLPLSTDQPAWKFYRAAWNIGRVFSGDRIGGFQYSSTFQERLWQRVSRRVRGGRIINCFQMYPPSIVGEPSIERWYFIDLTLLQLFDFYHERDKIGRRIAAQAMEREREGYHAAKGVVVMSRFAKESVCRDYDVPETRVHVIPPGANLRPDLYRAWEAGLSGDERGLAPGAPRLVAVVTSWQRKGLDRLLRALAMGRRIGLKSTLRVIGCNRDSLPRELTDVDGVEWLGRIDKRIEAERFLYSLADCDVGCILPRYEAGGSVLREFHALGLAVFCTEVGGTSDFMLPGASVTVGPNASDEEILAVLTRFENEHGFLERLRSAAWRQRHSTSWSETIRRLSSVVYGQVQPAANHAARLEVRRGISAGTHGSSS